MADTIELGANDAVGNNGVNGNVGIGTDAANDKLVVKSNTTTTITATSSASSTAGIGISAVDGQNRGDILIDGVARMTIKNGGSVGIATTNPSNNADLTLENGALCLKESSTPTADSNYGKIYTKSDNKLYFQDGAGNEHEIAFV